MYTGLPLMPAAIPENATRGSSALIRITSCWGRKLFTTETTRILNGSGLVPEKTVCASPTMPARTSDTGMILGGGPLGTSARIKLVTLGGPGFFSAAAPPLLLITGAPVGVVTGVAPAGA